MKLLISKILKGCRGEDRVANNEKHLNAGLKVKLQEYDEDVSKKYIDFYDDIPNENLKKLLSIYHYKFNNLFEYLNSRLNTRHYTAQESRELISVIKDFENLKMKLKGTELEFDIEQYYLETISQCKLFLQSSGGSTIPEDFKEIKIIDLEPAFILSQNINIRNEEKKVSYKIKSIGEGSYADVFKYKDEYYDKYFAIKKAKSDLRDDEYERFKIEYEETKKLKSPYIIEVYNFDEGNKQYTMEYMDMTLEKYIFRNNNKLSIKDRVNIVGQILKAFTYIHSKNVLHRDISTKNVLIKIYEDVIVAKISDFGLVKLPNSNLTRKGTEIKGYLNDHKNLEIIGFENYNIKHETYALTKLIYFIMTGKSSLERYDKTEFKTFVERGIVDNLDERYSNIDELKEAFNNTIKSLKYS